MKEKEIMSVHDLIHASFESADMQQPDCFIILCAIEWLSICRPSMTVLELIQVIKTDNPRAFQVPPSRIPEDVKKQILSDFRKSQKIQSQNLI